jgi:hypothetical protein
MIELKDVKEKLLTRVEQVKMQIQNQQSIIARLRQQLEQACADLNAMDGALQAGEETLKYFEEPKKNEDVKHK